MKTTSLRYAMAAAVPMARAATNELHDIRPPVEIPNPWIWVAWILATLLVLAIVGFVLGLILKKRKTEIPKVPVVPAHIRAKQKLEEALALISQPKPFCTAVSDTTRFYLEEQFNFRAPERTTEEFLHELQATDLLLPDQKESLGEFLKRCDLVKFARYEPGEPELRDLHSSALRLIEETEPQPLPQPGGQLSAADRPPAVANQQ